MGRMYMSLDEKQIKRIEEASNITEIDFGIKDSQMEYDTYDSIVEELMYAYHKLEEEFEDYREDVREHYESRKFNPYKEYGVSEHDFH